VSLLLLGGCHHGYRHMVLRYISTYAKNASPVKWWVWFQLMARCIWYSYRH